MTTNAPSVPNHLIREIMHAIQHRGNGDAMGCLAISSKEALSVFKYVIGHDVIGDLGSQTEADRIKNPRFRSTLAKDTDNDDEIKMFRMSPIEFNMKALYTIATRNLRKLRVQLNRISDLPKLNLENNITELTVTGCIHHDEPSLIPILDSWKSLQSFKVEDLTNNSIDQVRSVVLQSKNLLRLDFEIESDQLENLLTTVPAFPFPEIVTLRCHFDDDHVPISFAHAQTFPCVKQLHFQCNPEIPPTFEFFQMLRNIVQCFPSLNVAKLDFNSLHTFSHEQNGNNQITDWHEWLNNAAFAVPVEINSCTGIKFTHNDNIDPLYAYLKSVGFTDNGKSYHLIMEKKFPNVKLIHRITPNYVLSPFDQGIIHMFYSAYYDEDVIGEEWMNEE
uniref:F-box domain-containing protein n=1 Tax=Panagrellus redivivus TaxID=6233 RepID=A0A7E4VF96_PANRE